MDIEEIKKYSKNKIEADELIKQVRQRIKETTWEKQNLREGFTETFKPLISQFEKPEDPSQKNIFTQNQEMLRNQLALTEGIRGNQQAITRGGNKFDRLIETIEALQEAKDEEDQAIEDEEEDKDDQARAPLPKDDQAQAPLAKFKVEDFDINLNNKKSIDILKDNGYNHLPSYYFDKNISEISSLIDNVNSDLGDAEKDIKTTGIIENNDGYRLARAKNENLQSKTYKKLELFNTLSIYSTNLHILSLFKKKQTGSGMFFNPQDLLKRFELLNGSLAAGNNGVLPEYIQMAHRLRDLGIITNNQLNTLLRKII